MKKTIFLIVIGVITVGCIIFGTFRQFGFWSGKRTDKIGFSISYDTYSEDDDDFDGKNGRYNKTLEEFSQIRVNTNIGAIRVQEGSEYHIEAVYNKPYLKPNYTVTNGTLVISQSAKKNNSGGHTCKVIITVPAAANIKSIDIVTNVGDVDVRDMSGDEISVSLNVGEVELHNIDFNKIEASNNVGEVSIKLSDDVDNYSLRLSSDLGAVNVKGNSYRRHYESKGDTSKKLSASTNIGAVNVK